MKKGTKWWVAGALALWLFLTLGAAQQYRTLDVLLAVVTIWFVVLLSIHQVRIWLRQPRARAESKDRGVAARTWRWFYGE